MLLGIAGEWSQLKDAVEEGALERQYGIIAHVIAAVRLVRQSRSSGQPIEALIGQGDVFTGSLNPMTESVVRLLYHNLKRIRARDTIAADLRG